MAASNPAEEGGWIGSAHSSFPLPASGMATEALFPLKRFHLRLWSWLGPRPWLSGAGLVLIFLAGCLGGSQLFAGYHYRGALAAREDQRFDEARYHIQQCLRVWRWSVSAHLQAARIERFEAKGDFYHMPRKSTSTSANDLPAA